MNLQEEFNELVKEAQPKCNGHYSQIPKGVIESFIKNLESRFKEEKKQIDLEILLYNQKLEITSLINNLSKTLELFKELDASSTLCECKTPDWKFRKEDGKEIPYCKRCRKVIEAPKEDKDGN